MNPLPSQAKALLERARAEQAPADPELKQRVLQGIAVSLTAGMPEAHLARMPRPTRAARAGTVAAGKKLAALAMVLGLTGLGAWELRGHTGVPPSAPAPQQRSFSHAPIPVPAPGRASQVPPSAHPPLGEGPRDLHPDAVPRRSGDEVLHGELRLIARAEAALRRGDLGPAAAALELHERRYPKGQLATERAGLSLIVHCARGHDHSVQEAALYLAGAPDGIVADRVARACGVPR